MTMEASVKVHPSIPSLQKTLTIAGIGVALFAAIATVFSLITGQVFIHDILDASYYGRYAITIIGGFGVGLLLEHFLQKKEHGKIQKRASLLFTGVVFSLLTLSLFHLLDFLRFPLINIFGDPVYPWGKLIFQGIPIAALMLVAVFAATVYFMRQRALVSRRWFQLLFISIFGLVQAGWVVTAGLISDRAQFSIDTLYIGLLGFILTPLAMAIIAYLALGGISDRISRLFASSIIGAIYGALMFISWEFSTNPEYRATITFSIIVSVATYTASVALILTSRHMVHKK